MKRFLQSEIGAAVTWVICSLLLAALITPWVYQGGKNLASAVEARQIPAMFGWLGSACGRAKFSRYFDRSLMFSALVFLPILLRRIKLLRSRTEDGRGDARIHVPWREALVQISVGWLISGVLLAGLGCLVIVSGAYTLRSHNHFGSQFVMRVLFPTVSASFIEEWLFRGLLLGLWLRFARPAAACVGTSLLFAFLHFLEPPSGMVIANPGGVFAGFDLLGKILLHFTDPLFFVTDFATLFVIGVILAWARVRTGALWFSIGLHAGWIMSFKAFNILGQPVASPLHPWGVGDNLRSGVLPLATLAVTGLVCRIVLRRFSVTRDGV